MAKSVRSRRTTIAAGTLSLALVAPFVSPVQAQETTGATRARDRAPAAMTVRRERTDFAMVAPLRVQRIVSDV